VTRWKARQTPTWPCAARLRTTTLSRTSVMNGKPCRCTPERRAWYTRGCADTCPLPRAPARQVPQGDAIVTSDQGDGIAERLRWARVPQKTSPSPPRRAWSATPNSITKWNEYSIEPKQRRTRTKRSRVMQTQYKCTQGIRSATHLQLHHPTRKQVLEAERREAADALHIAVTCFLHDGGVHRKQTNHIRYLRYGCSCKATLTPI
jgi:hypothetical protein